MAPTWDTSKSGSSKTQSKASQSFKSGGGKQKSQKKDESSDEDSPGPSKGPNAPSGDRREGASRRSFIIVVENLRPVYDKRAPQATKHGNWDPPITTSGLLKGDRGIFRWRDGVIVPLESAPANGRHGVASVFPQSAAGQLLVVNVDASVTNIRETTKGTWRGLRFHHRQTHNSDRSYFSYLDFVAEHECTAATIENHCVPQLLPHFHNRSTPNKRRHAGLIGRLPLLIAIAALSGPRNLRNPIMRGCIQPGRWARHTRDCGRNEAGHGVVVSIYYDRENPNGSTKKILECIQDGDDGPFYGP